MKLSPTAVCRSKTCPGPGAPTSTSSKRRTSGPPTSWTRTAPLILSSLRLRATGYLRLDRSPSGDRGAPSGSRSSGHFIDRVSAEISGRARSMEGAEARSVQLLPKLIGRGDRRQTCPTRADIGGRPAVDRVLARGRIGRGEFGAGRDREHEGIGRRRSERGATKLAESGIVGRADQHHLDWMSEHTVGTEQGDVHRRIAAGFSGERLEYLLGEGPILVPAGQGVKTREDGDHG